MFRSILFFIFRVGLMWIGQRLSHPGFTLLNLSLARITSLDSNLRIELYRSYGI
jgi:hypothetical protein